MSLTHNEYLAKNTAFGEIWDRIIRCLRCCHYCRISLGGRFAVFDLALRPFEKFERSGHLVLVPFFQKGGDNIFLHKPWNQP